MAKSIVRKSTLALVLVLLTAGVSKTFAQQAPAPPPPSQPSPVGDPGGGEPAPPDPGPSLTAIHLK